ncbi:Exopolyphosphatase [Mitosporidium daphniae]
MPTPHFIVGNESSDLDSIVSSIVVAKYGNELFGRVGDVDTKHIAVLVTPGDMFFFKKYCSYVVENIMDVDLTDTSEILFIDDFMTTAKCCDSICVSLVDGPQIPLFLRLFNYNFQVFNIIDHHCFDASARYLGECVFIDPCASNCTNVFRVMWEKIFHKNASTSTLESIFFEHPSHAKHRFWENPHWFAELLEAKKEPVDRVLLALLCVIVVDSIGMDMDGSDKVTIHDVKACLSILQYLRIGKFISLCPEEFEQPLLFAFVRENHLQLFGSIFAHLKEYSSFSATALLVSPQIVLQLDYKDYLYEFRDAKERFFAYGISSISCSLYEFVSDCSVEKETASFADFSSKLVAHFALKAKLIPNYSFLFVMTCQSREIMTNDSLIADDAKSSFIGARQLSFCSPADYFGTLDINDAAECVLENFEQLFPGLISNLELKFVSALVANSFVTVSFIQGKYKMSRKAIQPVIHESIGHRSKPH